MKERPILFSAPMVRAILAGDKTLTRRDVTRLGEFGQITEFGPSDTAGYDWNFRDSAMRWHDLSHADLLKACPYGGPGDHLWVRETWQAWRLVNTAYDEWEPISVKEAAASRQHNFEYGPTSQRIEYRATNESTGPWTPSIHMPRWACRILLEVTGVRVERLQDISQADAYAEGAMSWAQEQETPIKDLNGGDDRMAFMALWESIGGTGSWDANPWVWVIEFKRHVA